MQRVLVTGGNRGIGLAACEALARQGYAVALGSRDIDHGTEVAARLVGLGDLDVRPIQIDLASNASIERAVEELAKENFPLDALVHNAGVLTPGGALSTTLEDMDHAWRVHVTGPHYLSRLVIPGMIERGRGRVVFVSSSWGSFARGLEGPAAYSITKAALNALVVKLDQDTPESILVNAVNPGWVRTRMGGEAADRTTAEGADTVVYAATLPADGPSGTVLRDRQIDPF